MFKSSKIDWFGETIIVFMTIVVTIFCSCIILFVLPNHHITKESDYLTQTQKKLVSSLYDDYMKIEVRKKYYIENDDMRSHFEDQQSTILKRLKLEVSKLNSDQVPSDIKIFLKNH